VSELLTKALLERRPSRHERPVVLTAWRTSLIRRARAYSALERGPEPPRLSPEAGGPGPRVHNSSGPTCLPPLTSAPGDVFGNQTAELSSALAGAVSIVALARIAPPSVSLGSSLRLLTLRNDCSCVLGPRKIFFATINREDLSLGRSFS